MRIQYVYHSSSIQCIKIVVYLVLLRNILTQYCCDTFVHKIRDTRITLLIYFRFRITITNMCYFCSNALPEHIGFRDECSSCRRPLHCCKNCMFFKPGAYHDCAEPQADFVQDKEGMNFCEYFKPGTTTVKPSTDDAKKKFNDLFS